VNVAPALVCVFFVCFFLCSLLFLSAGRAALSSTALYCPGAADARQGGGGNGGGGGGDDEDGGASPSASPSARGVCVPYTLAQRLAALSWLAGSLLSLATVAVASAVIRHAAAFEEVTECKLSSCGCGARSTAAAAAAAVMPLAAQPPPAAAVPLAWAPAFLPSSPLAPQAAASETVGVGVPVAEPVNAADIRALSAGSGDEAAFSVPGRVARADALQA